MISTLSSEKLHKKARCDHYFNMCLYYMAPPMVIIDHSVRVYFENFSSTRKISLGVNLNLYFRHLLQLWAYFYIYLEIIARMDAEYTYICLVIQCTYMYTWLLNVRYVLCMVFVCYVWREGMAVLLTKTFVCIQICVLHCL